MSQERPERCDSVDSLLIVVSIKAYVLVGILRIVHELPKLVFIVRFLVSRDELKLEFSLHLLVLDAIQILYWIVEGGEYIHLHVYKVRLLCVSCHVELCYVFVVRLPQVVKEKDFRPVVVRRDVRLPEKSRGLFVRYEIYSIIRTMSVSSLIRSYSWSLLGFKADECQKKCITLRKNIAKSRL